MTEQKGEAQNFIFESLGPKNRDGLLGDLAEKVKQELSSGTTQMSIVVGEGVRFGTPPKTEQHKKPRYAGKGGKK